jgi:hypothetical protein
MSDQNQNEPNQKQQREMLLFYTPIYNLVIQSRMLGLVERDLVILFASYKNLGCNWARASLMERSECGPYSLDRAILRLEFMHIIHTVQGRRIPGSKRREKNRYTFQTNPYLWRVTKDMQELIIEETKRMGKEPQPFKYPAFPNQFGLEKSLLKFSRSTLKEKRVARKTKTIRTNHRRPRQPRWWNRSPKRPSQPPNQNRCCGTSPHPKANRRSGGTKLTSSWMMTDCSSRLRWNITRTLEILKN